MRREAHSFAPRSRLVTSASVACSLVFLLLLSPSFSYAQLAVTNPKQLEIPKAKAEVLLQMACKAVREEFHTHDQPEMTLQTTLVLGSEEEHFLVDQEGHAFICLAAWDASKFATLAMRLCVQRLATPPREARLLKKILQGSEKVGPVSVKQLEKERGLARAPRPSREKADCMSAVRDQPCVMPNQRPHF